MSRMSRMSRAPGQLAAVCSKITSRGHDSSVILNWSWAVLLLPKEWMHLLVLHMLVLSFPFIHLSVVRKECKDGLHCQARIVEMVATCHTVSGFEDCLLISPYSTRIQRDSTKCHYSKANANWKSAACTANVAGTTQSWYHDILYFGGEYSAPSIPQRKGDLQWEIFLHWLLIFCKHSAAAGCFMEPEKWVMFQL